MSGIGSVYEVYGIIENSKRITNPMIDVNMICCLNEENLFFMSPYTAEDANIANAKLVITINLADALISSQSGTVS